MSQGHDEWFEESTKWGVFACHVNMSVHTCLYLNEMSPSMKIQKSSARGFMKEVTLKDSTHGCADVEYVTEK